MITPDESLGFNPRPCVRGDFRRCWEASRKFAFQSTPLCEGRRARFGRTMPREKRFNPRPCVRGDYIGALLGKPCMLFQSTPLCEGRRFLGVKKPWMSEFQSTPLCEGRRRRLRWWATANSFNPRPCVRGDACGRNELYNHDAGFQSTPLCEGRPSLRGSPSRCRYVSIHAPV